MRPLIPYAKPVVVAPLKRNGDTWSLDLAGSPTGFWCLPDAMALGFSHNATCGENRIYSPSARILELIAGALGAGGEHRFKVQATIIAKVTASGVTIAGSNTRIALTGNAGDPASLVDGDVFLDTTDKAIKTKRATLATGAPFCTALYRNTADSSAIANTASETNFDVNTSIPAGSLVTGSCLWIRAAGKLSTTGTPTIQLRLKFGSVVVLLTTALTCNSGAADNAWYIDGFVHLRSTGASGTVTADGNWSNGRSTFPLGNAGTVTIDTTAAQTVQVSAQWSAASASNTITLQNLRVVQLW